MLQFVTKTKDARNRIKIMFFSASFPNSLTQDHEISILLMSWQELSEKDSENMYPTKSKSLCCSLYTTEHSHFLPIDLITFFSLYIPLPLILHFSSPAKKPFRTPVCTHDVVENVFPSFHPIQIVVKLHEHGYGKSSRRKP